MNSINLFFGKIHCYLQQNQSHLIGKNRGHLQQAQAIDLIAKIVGVYNKICNRFKENSWVFYQQLSQVFKENSLSLQQNQTHFQRTNWGIQQENVDIISLANSWSITGKCRHKFNGKIVVPNALG